MTMTPLLSVAANWCARLLLDSVPWGDMGMLSAIVYLKRSVSC